MGVKRHRIRFHIVNNIPMSCKIQASSRHVWCNVFVARWQYRRHKTGRPQSNALGHTLGILRRSTTHLHSVTPASGYENSYVGISTHTRDFCWALRSSVASSREYFKEGSLLRIYFSLHFMEAGMCPLWFICWPLSSWNCVVSLLTTRFRALVSVTFFVVIYLSVCKHIVDLRSQT